MLRRAAEEVEAVPLGGPLHRGASRTSRWGGDQFPLLPTVAVVVEVVNFLVRLIVQVEVVLLLFQQC